MWGCLIGDIARPGPGTLSVDLQEVIVPGGGAVLGGPAQQQPAGRLQVEDGGIGADPARHPGSLLATHPSTTPGVGLRNESL